MLWSYSMSDAEKSFLKMMRERRGDKSGSSSGNSSGSSGLNTKNKSDESRSDSSSSGHAGSFVNKFAQKGNTKENILGQGGDKNPKGSSFANRFGSSENKKPEAFAKESSVVRKSKSVNNQNFSDATRRSRIDCVFLVRGKDKGRAAWHYVLVDKSKKEMFLAKSKTGSIDVAEYGEILHSGWGQDPPESIVSKIKEEFGG